MSWDEVGVIGQVFGSVGVFITLGYLAVQLRHARTELRRSISQGRAETARELNMTRASNQWLNEVGVKANKALGGASFPFVTRLIDAGLGQEEAFALAWEQAAWWQYRAHVIRYIDELTEDERVEFETATRVHYTNFPAYRLWFDTVKSGLNPAAVRYVDNLLARVG